ncbi:MAG TPA: MDR family MFS transporter, partial [Symbiobacteriaceae bacterium]|nr:MDR family MFS transporter [Symbiobacteriaceae bacterium]
YMLASTAIVPIVGKLADLYGRRRWYLLGMSVFIIGSALCGTAQTMTQLIIFRGIQGLGGGMLMPIAQTIVGDLYPGPERAKMQGVFGAIFGVASILGPKLGGWIVDSMSWRWVFYINLPFGILALIIIGFWLRESIGQERRSVDYLGSLTIAAGTCLVLLGLTQGGQQYAWGSWQIISMLGGGVALWALFVAIESRVAEPILPLDLLRNRVFAVANAVGLLMGLGMFGALVFIPMFMQGVVGVSASKAGSVMTPMMLSVITASILGGRLLLRIGYRTQLATGMVIMAVGFYFMSTMGVGTTQMTATIYMIAVGFGLGLVMPTITIAVQNAFPASRRGVVTSATTFFRSIGGTLGVATLGVVMNNRAADLITSKMAPIIAKVPAAAAPALAPLQAMIAKEPQTLFGLLLRPELLKQVPQALQAPLVQVLKESMAGALHTVFLVGLSLVCLGIAVSLFMGNARLTGEKGDGTQEVAPMLAD